MKPTLPDSVNIRPTKLYRLRSDLCREALVICLSAGVKPGEVLWLAGSRPSSLGGYLGHFFQTYVQVNGYSPTGKDWPNMPMDYFEAID